MQQPTAPLWKLQRAALALYEIVSEDDGASAAALGPHARQWASTHAPLPPLAARQPLRGLRQLPERRSCCCEVGRRAACPPGCILHLVICCPCAGSYRKQFSAHSRCAAAPRCASTPCCAAHTRRACRMYQRALELNPSATSSDRAPPSSAHNMLALALRESQGCHAALPHFVRALQHHAARCASLTHHVPGAGIG